MSKNTFVCPICKEIKRGEMFHCPDHCMDMCRDHVRETASGQYVCLTCDRNTHKFVHNGNAWVEV